MQKMNYDELINTAVEETIKNEVIACSRKNGI